MATASSNADAAKAELNQDFNALKNDLDALRSDIAKLSDTVRGIAGDGVQSATARVRETAGRVRDSGAAMTEEFGHRIEERPLLSVAVAFGVGMLIGRLLDRH